MCSSTRIFISKHATSETMALPLCMAFALCIALSETGRAADAPSVAQKPATTVANRPKVPGRLKLHLRSRKAIEKGKDQQKAVVQTADWNVAETVIIICDMWDGHYCKLAAERVATMAPRMNRVISSARAHGIMIIHAPSGTIDQYADTPHRLRMQQTKSVAPPIALKGWCYRDPQKEPLLPVDVSNCACDDPVVGKRVRRFSRQHEAIKIIGYDGVSANGSEIYSFCRNNGIKNVVLMGVHTNMCVLGRPFGIRQMVNVGMNVVLARDLTDAMYDPREFPYVSHTRGTELVIEHIERYWCPSILVADLMKVIPGSADPDPEQLKRRPRPETAKR